MADIHANLEALQAVLADAKEQQCTHPAFLGDFVGYCADPKACIDIVRSLKSPCVKGNYDEYVSMALAPDGLNPKAAKAIQWTRNQLTDEDRRWLATLPYVLTVENFTITHATLALPEQWEYVFDKCAANSSFACQNTSVSFFGHTHVPVAFVRDTMVRGGTYTHFQLEREKQYFINVGSVGQPRDNNPKAAYVIYDLERGTIELRRLSYDIETTQRKIREAGIGR
jgi:diadenosine tetraphosphatase ApaH/serine/threonine PP2A family protein phosphatase